MHVLVDMSGCLLIIMGSMFVFVVLFMPNGIVGVYKQVKNKFAQKRSLQTAEA